MPYRTKNNKFETKTSFRISNSHNQSPYQGSTTNLRSGNLVFIPLWLLQWLSDDTEKTVVHPMTANITTGREQRQCSKHQARQYLFCKIFTCFTNIQKWMLLIFVTLGGWRKYHYQPFICVSEINLKLGCEKLKAYTESLFLQKILKLAYQPQKDYSKPANYAKKMLYPNSNRCLQEAA